MLGYRIQHVLGEPLAGVANADGSPSLPDQRLDRDEDALAVPGLLCQAALVEVVQTLAPPQTCLVLSLPNQFPFGLATQGQRADEREQV